MPGDQLLRVHTTQDSSVYEPEVMKALFDRHVPYTKATSRPKWLSTAPAALPDSDNDNNSDEDATHTGRATCTAPATLRELWDLRVQHLVKRWASGGSPDQLLFMAEVVTYVEHVRALAKSPDPAMQEAFNSLPVMGPRFLPPSAATIHFRKRQPLESDLWPLPVTVMIDDFCQSLQVMCPEGFSKGR
jgi:hypothetical protein